MTSTNEVDHGVRMTLECAFILVETLMGEIFVMTKEIREIDTTELERPFEDRAARWVMIRKGEDPSIPKEQANAYRQDYLFEEIVERAVARTRELSDFGQADTLISLVGFSPETTIITTMTLRPRRLVLLYTKNSQRGVNAIADWLISREVMDHVQIAPVLCEAINPLSIYKLIHQQLEDSSKLLDKEQPHNMIDITGGKKVMSAAAALVAWQLDMGLAYVENDYDEVIRMPRPGSEYVLLLDNPMTIFGDQELESGKKLFNAGNHTAASEHFSKLASRVQNPVRPDFYAKVARMYDDWTAFRFDRVGEQLDQLRTLMDARRNRIADIDLIRLERQLDFLNVLVNSDDAERKRDHRILCYFALGKFFEQQGRLDFAALLYYRTCEAVSQERLKRQYRIDTSKPDYTELRPEQLQAWLDLCQEVYGSDKLEAPRTIALVNGLILLSSLQDAVTTAADLVKVGKLKAINGIVMVRNRSILAHGFDPIEHRRLEHIEQQSRNLLGAYWSLYYADAELEDLLADLQFIKLPED